MPLLTGRMIWLRRSWSFQERLRGAPCRTTPLRFHDSYVPPTRHRGLASSKRNAPDAGERAQEETHQVGDLRWRTKIGAPPADVGRNWRRAAIRLKAVPLSQALPTEKADALRQPDLQHHASHAKLTIAKHGQIKGMLPGIAGH